ncbi:MAG: peptidoglycan DD-metalloendopeptidase family protein [bacterium]|nr:peptidoglycan DD-metalloendopeptidase family protein [bacterium]
MKTFAFLKILAVLLFFSLAFSATVSWAQTPGELKKVIDQKNEEIRRLEEEAKKYKDEVYSTAERGKTLKAELIRIDKTVKQLRKDIDLTEKKMKNTELEIKKTGIEIKEKDSSIKKMNLGLANTLRVIYENDGLDLIEILLQEGDIAKFLSHMDYTEILQSKITASVSDLKTVRGELKTKKAEAEEKKEKLKNLGKTLIANKQTKEEIQKERQNLLVLTKNQEARYQVLLEETEDKQEELEKEIEDLEEKLRLLIDPSSLPKAKKSFFDWPIEGILSQGYGETPFTKSKKGRHFYKFHNGIDIAAPTGTPIKAADDGTVLGTGNTDNYCPKSLQGKYTVIDHKNNLASMYAHQSLITVSQGQQVKRGDIIGYVGSTGKSTGPHLHFTVYDSRTLEIKKGPTGACGPVPIGGSINPLQYLD